MKQTVCNTVSSSVVNTCGVEKAVLMIVRSYHIYFTYRLVPVNHIVLLTASDKFCGLLLYEDFHCVT